MKEILLLIIIVLIVPSSLWASEVVLNSGQKVEGKITEQTDKYIKIDSGFGETITYYANEIASIDGQNFFISLIPQQSNNFKIKLYKVLHDSGFDDQTSKDLALKLSPIGDLFPIKDINDPEGVRETLFKSKDSVRSFLFPNDQITKEALDILVLLLGKSDGEAVKSFYSGKIIDFSSAQMAAFDCSFFALISDIILKTKGLDVRGVLTSDVKTLAYLFAVPENKLLKPFQDAFNIRGGHALNFVLFSDGRFLFADFINGYVSNLYPFSENYRSTLGDFYLRSQDKKDLYKNIELVGFNGMLSALLGTTAPIFFNKNDPTETILFYDTAVEKSPDLPEVYIYRGLFYENFGDLNQAIKDYSTAIGMNPNISYAFDNRGNVYYKQGNFTQAMSDYNKAIELDPNYAEAYSNRGTIYENEDKNFVQALLDFNKSIEIDPYYVEAYYNRAILYYEQAQYDNAWNDLHKAEQLGFTGIDPKFITVLKQVSGKDQ